MFLLLCNRSGWRRPATFSPTRPCRAETRPSRNARNERDPLGMGRTVREIASTKFVRAGETVSRQGLSEHGWDVRRQDPH